MIVNLDVDGTLYDFIADCRRALETDFSPNHVRAPDPTGWNIWDDWYVRETADDPWRHPDRDEFWHVVERHILRGFVYGTSEHWYPGALEFVQSLIDDGHTVRFVTSKSSYHHPEVRRAAYRNSVNLINRTGLDGLDAIIFSGDDKTGYPADVVVDDHPDLGRWCQGTALNLLFDRPWNYDAHPIRYDVGGTFERVETYDDITARIAETGSRGAARPDPIHDWVPDETPDPRELAATAQELVYGDRQGDYGHPADDFSRTAQIWSALLGTDVTAEQVALCMVGVKLSRETNRPKPDNVVDAHGYLLTYGRVRRRREGLE